MKKFFKSIFTAALMNLSIVGSANATTVFYTAESISGSDWRYQYTIDNNTLTQNIDQFTIYFDRTLFTNLAVQSSPLNWDSLVIQLDNEIPADGYFDSLSLIEGIAPGSLLSGFSVIFTYLGSNTPGSQPFDIVDASFNIIDSGVSTESMPSPVPEPKAYILLLTGFGLIYFTILKRRRNSR